MVRYPVSTPATFCLSTCNGNWLETLCIHNIRQRQRHCGGRKTRPGGLSTPGRGQGEGPAGDKFPRSGDAGNGGRGRSEQWERRARSALTSHANGVPRAGLPPSAQPLLNPANRPRESLPRRHAECTECRFPVNAAGICAVFAKMLAASTRRTHRMPIFCQRGHVPFHPFP